MARRMAWALPYPMSPPMRPPAALLLDMDGTLLDTEPLHFAAHRRFLATVGIVPSEEDLVGNVGKGDRTFYRDLMQRAGVVGDAAAWVAQKTDVLIDIYRSQGVPVRPGAHELLDHAAVEGVPTVLVTSSERRLAEAALEVSGLARRLPMRICAEDVARHKPHPDPFLLAVSRLGVSPGRSLAVEDSGSGVAAAHAAGCTVVGVRGHVPEAELRRRGACLIIDRMDELVPLAALPV
jgi:HAD superfamily hydrolase (TIGR01509 family)